MSNQTRIGLVITLVALFAFPVEVSGGGFGLFKCFRVQRATCCPPPKCEPCPPVTCEPCPPVTCEPCPPVTCEPCPPVTGVPSEPTRRLETTTQYSQCWYAVGSGMGCSTQSGCVEGPGDAIDEAYDPCVISYTLYPCACSSAAPHLDPAPLEVKEDQETAAAEDPWKVYVLSLNPNGKPVFKRATQNTHSTASEAADNGRGSRPGWKDILFVISIK